MIKKVLLRTSIPFIIMECMALILFFIGKSKVEYMGTAFTGLIVSIVLGSSLIYNIDTWSLIKKTIVHFCVMVVTIFPILLISGWFTINSVFDYLKIFLYFIFIGIILWTLGFCVSVKFSKKWYI